MAVLAVLAGFYFCPPLSGFFWLESPQGRTNKHDPKFTAGASGGGPAAPFPTATATPNPCDVSAFVSVFGGPLAGQAALIRDLEWTPSGDIFAVDSKLNKVIHFDSNLAVLSEWGGLANPTKFHGPQTVDEQGGIVYVSDGTRIQKFDGSGNYIGSILTNFNISAVCVTSNNLVYAIMQSVGRIQGTSTIGPGPTGGFGGGVGSGNGQFLSPADLWTDTATGNIYVLENNRVQVLSSAGTYLSQWAVGGGGMDDNGAGGLMVATGAACSTYDGAGTLLSSQSAGSLGFWRVSEGPGGQRIFASYNSGTITKTDAAGTVLQTWADGLTRTGQSTQPLGMAVFGANLYVIDAAGLRVNKFDLNGAAQLAWSTGTGSSSTNGIATDSAGNVYVPHDLASGNIQKFSPTGALLATFGTAGTSTGQLSFATSVAVDSGGDILVTDRNRQKVLRYNSAGTFVSEFGVNGTLPGQFQSPWGIAVESSGNILVGDPSRSTVQRFSPAGVFMAVVISGVMPYDLSVSSLGNIAVVYEPNVGTNQVRIYSPTGTLLRSLGCQGPAPGQFYHPRGLAFGPGGVLFVSDTDNLRLQKFNTGL